MLHFEETDQDFQAFKTISSWPFLLKLSTLFCYNLRSQYIKFFEIVFLFFIKCLSFLLDMYVFPSRMRKMYCRMALNAPRLPLQTIYFAKQRKMQGDFLQWSQSCGGYCTVKWAGDKREKQLFVLTQSVDIWDRSWSYIWRRKRHALFLFQMVVGFINVIKDSPLRWVDRCATYIRIQTDEYKLWSYCGLMLSSSDRGGWYCCHLILAVR